MKENVATIPNLTLIVAALRGNGVAKALNVDKRNDNIPAKMNEKIDGDGERLTSSRSPIGNEKILPRRTRLMTRKRSERDATRTRNLEAPEVATIKSLTKDQNVAMTVAMMHLLPVRTTSEARSMI